MRHNFLPFTFESQNELHPSIFYGIQFLADFGVYKSGEKFQALHCYTGSSAANGIGYITTEDGRRQDWDIVPTSLPYGHNHLKPCPFCGSDIVGELTKSSIPTEKLGVVGCSVCGCSGPRNYDVHEFVPKWNQRYAEDLEKAALIEENKSLRHELFQLIEEKFSKISIDKALAVLNKEL